MRWTGHSRRFLVVIVVVSLLTLAAEGFSASKGASGSYLAPSTKRMAERLEAILAGASIADNPYLNQERVTYFRQLVSQGLDLRAELKIRLRLAEELVLAGSTLEAIEELQTLEVSAKKTSALLAPAFQRQVRDLRTLAFLRLGEQENCILHHNSDRCLLPIRASGVHSKKRGSRKAAEGLTAALKEFPNDPLGRWLLNIAYMTLGEYPEKVPAPWLIEPETFASDYEIKRFPDVAPAAELDVVGLSGGSIMEDFDGDGFLDIMASSWGPRDQLRYFRNKGDGSFEERTMEAGLRGLTGGLNLIHADYNNDGHADVLVLRGAWFRSQGRYPNSLLRNSGNGTFDDVTDEAGLLSFHPTQTAAWGDYDNDGQLDLFVGNETVDDDLHPSELYRNNGDGTFADVAASVGLAELGYVKGVVWGDYNNDGRLDLYVSRLAQDNLLFRNDGPRPASRQRDPGAPDTTQAVSAREWRFTDVTKQAGVADPWHSFATWFWDYNNDGWLDLLAAPYHTNTLGDIALAHLGEPNGAERARLYRNQGDGTFADVTKRARLDRVVLAMGANFGDLDNDGYLDCYFGTGEPDLRALLPNRMFRNTDGQSFQDVTTSGGFGHIQKGHGISFGDIDNDGDQDIYAVMGGAYVGDVFPNVLFQNPGHGNEWITLQFEGVESNRTAIGTRVRIRVETPAGYRDIFRTVDTGGSFGASSLQLEIGLGRALSILEVEVTWPATGVRQMFKGLQARRRWKIREGDENPVLSELQTVSLSP